MYGGMIFSDGEKCKTNDSCSNTGRPFAFVLPNDTEETFKNILALPFPPAPHLLNPV